MKIAILSDIHGNLPALEAVLDDIRKRKVDKLICLGDMIGKGPSSKEVIDLCKAECDITVRGNWEGALSLSEWPLHLQWCINDMNQHHIDFITSLPHSTEFYLGDMLVRLFHAHPKNFNRYFQDSPIEQRRELFDFNDLSEIKQLANVTIYGDIHTTYLQMIDGRYLINTGSVGCPYDVTQASYLIIESGNTGKSFNTQFIRVAYDIEKAVTTAKEANIPYLEGYISELRTAKYFAGRS